jgi:hypothetical protein
MRAKSNKIVFARHWFAEKTLQPSNNAQRLRDILILHEVGVAIGVSGMPEG